MAIQQTQQAYKITKATNPNDRHLFELCFAIAAQYETLERPKQATVSYLDALGHLHSVRGAAEREAGRIVTLDRIAQCYQDVGEQEAADRYYRQAIRGYENYRKTREEAEASSSSSDQDPDAQMRIDSEIIAVMHNYARQLLHLHRLGDAQIVLQRALSLAKAQQAPEALEQLEQLQMHLRDQERSAILGDPLLP